MFLFLESTFLQYTTTRVINVHSEDYSFNVFCFQHWRYETEIMKNRRWYL